MPIEQVDLFPQAQRRGVKLYIEHDKSVDDWIRENHYLRSTPAGAVLRMCFKNERHEILGCMMWGRPTSRKLDQRHILELTRMCFVNNTPPFIESQCLRMARKYIRTTFNSGRGGRGKQKNEREGIIGLVAYSSTGAGHEGIIYQADGWYRLGGSAGGSWESRANRVNRDLSMKIRWTRSP